jgi:hypothetical protein
MPRKRKLQLGAVVTMAGASLAFVALALGGARSRETITVTPGESIQRAIDRAQAGDAVVVAAGVYRENLTITKDHVTLRGAGARLGGTVLEPPARPRASPCNIDGVNGICVTGRFKPRSRVIGRPVTGVRVSGFLVRHFPRFGILLNNAVDTTISQSQASQNRGYGMVGFFLTRVRYVDDVSDHNGQGGFHIGDSPKAHAIVTGNKAYRNGGKGGLGMFFRDASHGLVRKNEVDSNCVGIFFVDSGQPGPASDWLVGDNRVRNNTFACPPPDEGGPRCPDSGLDCSAPTTRSSSGTSSRETIPGRRRRSPAASSWRRQPQSEVIPRLRMSCATTRCGTIVRPTSSTTAAAAAIGSSETTARPRRRRASAPDLSSMPANLRELYVAVSGRPS